MKLLGILVVLNSLIIAGWILNETNGSKWILGLCALAVFTGLIFIFNERITEISISKVGVIKAAAAQATIDAQQIAEIKRRIESQSSTIDLIANEAKNAKELSQSLEAKNKEAERAIAKIDEALARSEASLKAVEGRADNIDQRVVILDKLTTEAQQSIVNVREATDFIGLMMEASNDNRIALRKIISYYKDEKTPNGIYVVE